MFYGPIHFDDVNYIYRGRRNGILINNPRNYPDPTVRGIYIWGFVYECDNTNNLLEPLNYRNPTNINLYKNNKYKLCNNWNFIPFYVGQEGGRIFDRITQHHNVRANANAVKYFRFSLDYMKLFFKDPAFPFNPRLATILPLIPIPPISSPIEYFNQESALRAIYPGITPITSGRNNTDCPITEQTFNPTTMTSDGITPLPDTLDYLVNNLNNFWFCYMPLVNGENLNTYETYTFWSLKGKTTSYTEAFEGTYPTITNPTGNPIFKTDDLGNLAASFDFPGY